MKDRPAPRSRPATPRSARPAPAVSQQAPELAPTPVEPTTSGGLTHDGLLRLQRAQGNRAVQRMLVRRRANRSTIQRRVPTNKAWEQQTTISSFVFFTAGRGEALEAIDVALAHYHTVAGSAVEQRVRGLDWLLEKVDRWLAEKADKDDSRRAPAVRSLRFEILAERAAINTELESAVQQARRDWEAKWTDNAIPVRVAAIDSVLAAIASWQRNGRYTPPDAGKTAEMQKLKDELTAEKQAQQTIIRGDPLNLPSNQHRDPTLKEGSSSFNTPAPGGTAGQTVRQMPLPNTIFIGGTPSADDVKQYGIGDCYFLAALINLVSRDPGLIKSRFFLHGPMFQANFFSFNGAGVAQPQRIEVDQKLGYEIDDRGNSRYLKGAHLRVADTPAKVEVKNEVINGNPESVRYEYFETGMWAPLVEKAYATFAQTFGQYGNVPGSSSTSTTKSDGSQRSGYEMINEGGAAEYVYGIFYGPRYQGGSFNATSYNNPKNPDQNVVDNIAAIRLLLTQQTGGMPADKTTHLVARASADDHLSRCLALLKVVLAERGMGLSRGQRGALWRLHNSLQNWQGATNAASKERRKRRAARLAAQISNVGGALKVTRLHDAAAPKLVKDLRELILDVSNAGTDASPGQRMVYSSHAYAVLKSEFKDTGGAVLNVTSANVGTTINQISAEQSSVQMRNPHHTNEPDPAGAGPADGKDDGVFSLTLDQFLRNFSGIRAGTVQT